MSLRLPRLVILLAILLVSITLFLLYPSSRTPHSPNDPWNKYEAGGIDSAHYRDPITPDFERDEARARQEMAMEECDEPEGCAPPDQRPVQAPPLSGKERLAKGLQGGLGLANWFGGGGSKDSVSTYSGAGGASGAVHEDVLHGNVIMPKLENATAKAELGRAAWRVLHLMTLRYPESPSPTEREALKSYFHLFARMYPCGECAEEFQRLLKEYPPQTGSRKSASLWLCHVHNQVNLRLGKPEFDCLTLDATYDCGCGDTPAAETTSVDAKQPGAKGKTFPPPEKGQIGGKLLGGKKGGGKDTADGWKESVSGSGEAASPDTDDSGSWEREAKAETTVVFDEEARQAEMIELAQEELEPEAGDDF